MSNVTDQTLEDLAGTMQDALRFIASDDCHFDVMGRSDEERARPCECPPCVAQRVLRAVKQWRYRCSRDCRLKHNPRERALVEAWTKFADSDRMLSLILGEEGKTPSCRDWYVATSIVRWLGTNCGLGVLLDAMGRSPELKRWFTPPGKAEE